MNNLMKIKCVLLGLIGIVSVAAHATESTVELADQPYAAKVDAMLKKMTIDEKIGQLNLSSSGDITTGETKKSNVAKKIEEGKLGGLFNIS